jgi:hypothetical protein
LHPDAEQGGVLHRAIDTAGWRVVNNRRLAIPESDGQDVIVGVQLGARFREAHLD